MRSRTEYLRVTADTEARDSTTIRAGPFERTIAPMKVAIITATAVLLVACNNAKQPAEQAAAPSMPSAVRTASAAPEPHAPHAEAMVASGKVLETMNAGGYTYIKLANAKGEMWTAVPETKIEKGATVNVTVQMMAENFESSSLNRKFDRLAFGTIEGAPAAKPAMAPPSMASSAAPKVEVGNIEQPAGGMSVASVWKDRKSIAGKEITVRGKVVKFLPSIMGKNWMHLRDGSGSAESKDNDITVTTSEVARVGDVVTVTGKVSVDKDFGSGYAYPVIVEDAKVR